MKNSAGNRLQSGNTCQSRGRETGENERKLRPTAGDAVRAADKRKIAENGDDEQIDGNHLRPKQ